MVSTEDMEKRRERFSRIRELMIESKLRNAELARKLNISTGNISDWESGRSNPSTEKLMEISVLFDVSIDWICGLSPVRKRVLSDDELKKETPVGDLSKEILEVFEQLDRPSQMILLGEAYKRIKQ